MAGEAITALEGNKHDSEELREKWQELESQLQNLRNSSDIPAEQGVHGIEREERQGGEVHNDLQSSSQGQTAALDRIRGHRDSFVPWDISLRTDTDRVDREVERLRNEVVSLELQAKRNQDPERSAALERELEAARAQLRVKGSDAYRRRYAHYIALFEQAPEQKEIQA